MSNVLVVENDPATAAMERDFLEGSDYMPYMATNSPTALEILRTTDIDAVILNVDLPVEDGFSLCRKIRNMTDIPILFASSRGDDSDIVRGLGLGADDYLVQPFSGTVLIARLHAHIHRRSHLLQKTLMPTMIRESLLINDLTIYPKAKQVFIDDKEVILTTKEFFLLHFLATHPEEVFTKEQLIETVWKLEPIGDMATVTVHINRIRDKLQKASGRPYKQIETLWGIGYRFHLA